MNLEDFLETIGSSSGEAKELTLNPVKSKLTILKNDYNTSFLRLKDSEFFKPVLFSEVNFNTGIIFENCTFHHRIKLTECESSEVRSTPFDSGQKTTITFLNCEIDSLTIINSDFRRGVKIIDSSIKRTLRVVGSSGHSFVVRETRISGKVNLLKNPFKGSLKFIDVNIESSLSVSHSQYGAIDLEDVNVSGKTSFFEISSSSGIVLRGGMYNSDVSLQLIDSPEGKLFLRGAEFQGGFSVHCFVPSIEPNRGIKNPSELLIFPCSFSRGFYFDGGGASLRSINISSSPFLTGELNLSNCDTEHFKLEGEVVNANIFLKGLKTAGIDFSNVLNSSSILLNHIKSLEREDTFFRIESSICGKMRLFNVDLDSFSTIDISNSILSDIETSGVSWFAYEKLNQDRSDLFEKKEIFRMLKLAMGGQGDKVQAITFRKHEMATFLKHLKVSKPWYYPDRVLLFLARTNDFGTNWIKPLLLALTACILFFPLIVVSSSKNVELIPSFSQDGVLRFWDSLNENWEVIPQLLNPAHVLNRIFEGGELGFFAHFFDLIYRVVYSFFIFQVISGFRKFYRS